MVTLTEIDKAYQMGETSFQVLHNVSLSAKKGDYIAILGASGSGKSTLMNIVGCMDQADAGFYQLDEIDIMKCRDDELTTIRNEKIGFIFQNYHLIPQYTVKQNILLPLLIRGLPRSEAILEAESIIQLVGLTDRMDHRPRELSGGQQQRVAIARALVTKPSLLLADEPTGALDSKTGEDIMMLFNELNQMGNTIMMITHDEKVAKHAKTILRLSDGILTNY
ncbi:ABC transporter ATP-binding protein [Carnobacterium divergens]|uniref:ABC transporter ATP-binding protein n=1 Tax=Carnobacterium divergens TaxID=2748 RepID=UPI0035DD15AC